MSMLSISDRKWIVYNIATMCILKKFYLQKDAEKRSRAYNRKHNQSTGVSYIDSMTEKQWKAWELLKIT